MTGNNLKQLVPKLRFQEFRGDCEWERRKLGDVVSRPKETLDPLTCNDAPRLVELENIEAKTGRILGITELKAQRSIKLWFQAGDVLFGKLRPYLQKFARPNFQGVCTSEIWVLRGKEVSSTFLLQLVQTERFIQMANVSSGSRMPRAEWNLLAGSDFAIPQSAEQQKIADCLGSLDDLIDAEERKVEALRVHKQGLMQQMFPSLADG
ncbi:MAG: restriction endonuclease subunit S [Rhodobacteraceae bacterium]|nr:restriction endonuclease subunit S [Paracoccaceae bacterium]